MAANDYYSAAMHSRYDYDAPDRQYQPYSPAPPPPSTKPAAMYPSNQFNTPAPYKPYSPNQGYNGSEQTLRPTETNYSSSSLGRNEDPNQYSDTIPLKNSMKMTSTKNDWENENTKYDPTSMESQPPLSPVRDSKGGKGFFKGKIPWVVYFLTLVQCSVFIGEIVKYGALLTIWFEICTNNV